MGPKDKTAVQAQIRKIEDIALYLPIVYKQSLLQAVKEIKTVIEKE